MKTFRSVSMLFVAVAFVSPVSVQAQDFRTPTGGPSRSFLGLPIPQQWSGARPTSRNQSAGYGYSRGSTGLNSGTCANGQCSTENYATGYRPSGQCANGRCTTGTCRNCNCPVGACAGGLCASGQCPACTNGQCMSCVNGQCGNGQSATGNCPNGQCRQNQSPYAGSDYAPQYGVEGNWAPRTTRSNVADPFRRAQFDSRNDKWTPAATRSLNNNVPSPGRYERSELDLNRPYFHNQAGQLNDSRSSENSSVSRDVRAPRPVDRSMFGVPVDSAAGLARI